MKSKATLIAFVLLALILGVAAGRWWQTGTANETGDSAGEQRRVDYWVAPMDPDYRRDGPGKSPMGMDLVPVYADQADGMDSGVVTISPTVVNNLGVRTAAALRGPLARRIDTVGYVGYDEDTLFHIHTRVDGWIEALAVKTQGEPVTKGQKLFELYSPTLVSAQQEYLATLASRTSSLQAASRDRLAALGVTQGDIERLTRERTVRQRISVFAQSDGFVTELGVREGVYVDPARKVMTIAALDSVWVMARVFERQAGLVAAGQRAEVELDYLPGRRFEGSVDYVYPEVDPQTRTLTVRLRFDEQAESMRPNMYATVSIFGEDTGPVVHVPRESVIRGGVHDRVVLALGGGRFRAQPVTVGIESGGRVELRAGVSAGDLVVTSAQFLIDSESNIDAALERMREAPEEMDHSHHDMESGE